MHKAPRDVHVTMRMGQDLYVCECMQVQTSMGRVVRPTRLIQANLNDRSCQPCLNGARVFLVEPKFFNII